MRVKGKETMANRNDIHAPSTFDPAKYSYEGTVILAPPRIDAELAEIAPDVIEAIIKEYIEEREALVERCKAGGYTGNFLNKGTCDHCGAYFIYGAEFKHAEGNTIVVGHICADEAFGCDDRRAYDMKRAKGRTKASRERIKKLAIRERFIEESDLKAVFTEANIGHDSRAGSILADLNAKLYEWGSLTPKQADFARKLANDIANPKPIACDFCGDADHVAKECPNRGSVPLTDERITIHARIITARYEETQYGSSLKGLFETATGFKLWGTIPAAIHDAFFYEENEHGRTEHNDKTLNDLRGQYVSFVARVKRSDKDRTFGFINRPSKAGLAESFENTPVFPGGTPEPGDKTDDELRDALVAARKAL